MSQQILNIADARAARQQMPGETLFAIFGVEFPQPLAVSSQRGLQFLQNHGQSAFAALAGLCRQLQPFQFHILYPCWMMFATRTSSN